MSEAKSVTATQKSQGKWVDPLLRPVIAATIPSSGLDFSVKTTDEERIALSRALALNSVSAAEATYHLKRKSGGKIALTGRLMATVEPTCVVSLEPFSLKVDEPVEMSFVDADEQDTASHAVEHDLSGEDPPDVIDNGTIDLGKVTTEFLSLAIPPFPRKPDAVFEQGAELTDTSPFAALKQLQAKEK